jgi:hypothetical protein
MCGVSAGREGEAITAGLLDAIQIDHPAQSLATPAALTQDRPGRAAPAGIAGGSRPLPRQVTQPLWPLRPQV